jgi:hypothetical protein
LASLVDRSVLVREDNGVHVRYRCCSVKGSWPPAGRSRGGRGLHHA